MQRTHLSKEKIIVTYKSSFTLKRNQITSQDFIWNKKQQKTTEKTNHPVACTGVSYSHSSDSVSSAVFYHCIIILAALEMTHELC